MFFGSTFCERVSENRELRSEGLVVGFGFVFDLYLRRCYVGSVFWSLRWVICAFWFVFKFIFGFLINFGYYFRIGLLE